MTAQDGMKLRIAILWILALLVICCIAGGYIHGKHAADRYYAAPVGEVRSAEPWCPVGCVCSVRDWKQVPRCDGGVKFKLGWVMEKYSPPQPKQEVIVQWALGKWKLNGTHIEVKEGTNNFEIVPDVQPQLAPSQLTSWQIGWAGICTSSPTDFSRCVVASTDPQEFLEHNYCDNATGEWKPKP